MADLRGWLAELGLEKFEPAFTEHEIDFDVLRLLTEDDVKELGLPLGPRRKVLAALSALRAEIVPQPRDEAERRQLTVMFVDLADSTALAARLDPETMREILRGYQNAVTGEITRVGGHVAKLMGDGVLAYFGWPRAHEDDAERAVHAGLAATRAVGNITGPAGERLAARVGIATGLVVVGDLIGEGAAQEHAVVGPTPNLAARLQAEAGAGQVVIAARNSPAAWSRLRHRPDGRAPAQGLRRTIATVWRTSRGVAPQSLRQGFGRNDGRPRSGISRAACCMARS